jgi:beta-galactosidase
VTARRTLLAVLSLGAVLTVGAAVSALAEGPRLTIEGSQFRFHDAPLTIISGEMHYPRVPREYWRDRLIKARAMGLNTISTYVFWNLHEPAPGRYDFSGQDDVAAYIRLAGELGLHVIVRPGPYVCAEWELGGYPAWLLADPAIELRSTDPAFTTPAGRWLDRLGRELAPLFADRGGPIIAVQVENEYGSFLSGGDDKQYLTWQRAALVHAGFDHALLYTADGPAQLPRGTLPEVPAVVNFGPGDATDAFARLSAFRPGAPLMSGEYWAGWFDQWGERHHTTNAQQEATELGWLLDHGSVNLYMFHGGTTFGLMNGANIDRGVYHPQTSSYDYDSALDESGRPAPKYFLFRDVIGAHTGAPLAPVPPTPDPIVLPRVTLDRAASLWSMLGRPVHVERPRPMETFGQSYGDILYRTHVEGPVTGDLVIDDVRDYVQVYVDRGLVGTLDRRLNPKPLQVTVPAGGADLDLLVENSGRVNFSMPLRQERKGITKDVRLDGRELVGWEVFTLPMASMPDPSWSATTPSGPGFYRGTFTVSTTGDTFLDMRGWGKGLVWVNGHALGRYWFIGPTQTLYVPGPWLRRGSNEIVVFDLLTPAARTVAGLSKPILGG